jgi:GNAT superfamily N-acetyltransferase
LEDTKLNIRLATANDIEELSKLWLKMVGELDPTLTPNVDWWKQYAYTLMKSGRYFVYMAEDDNGAIGFVDYFIFPEPSTSKVHSVGQHFYVLPEHRGNAVSGRLYKSMVKDSKRLGADSLELCCFENQRSFWEKKGFTHKRNMMRKEG